MSRDPRGFALLFPASALFWWFFEYLNRFVQNWHYIDLPYGPWEYVFFATLPFSTVLPAVLSLQESLLAHLPLGETFERFASVRSLHPRRWAWLTLAVAGTGLTGIGVYPDHLFSFLWVSPLLLLVAVQTLQGEPHVFSPVTAGNWSVLAGAALAGLICGGFWEMWNYFSLAKWEYTIPFVQRFHLFEMPILGYAGYFPFGLECLAVGQLVLSKKETSP